MNKFYHEEWDEGFVPRIEEELEYFMEECMKWVFDDLIDDDIDIENIID